MLTVGRSSSPMRCGEACRTDLDCPNSQCFRCVSGICDSSCGIEVQSLNKHTHKSWMANRAAHMRIHLLGHTTHTHTHTHAHTCCDVYVFTYCNCVCIYSSVVSHGCRLRRQLAIRSLATVPCMPRRALLRRCVPIWCTMHPKLLHEACSAKQPEAGHICAGISCGMELFLPHSQLHKRRYLRGFHVV